MHSSSHDFYSLSLFFFLAGTQYGISTNEIFDQMASKLHTLYTHTHTQTQLTTVKLLQNRLLKSKEKNQHHFQIGHNKVVNFVFVSYFPFTFPFIYFFVFCFWFCNASFVSQIWMHSTVVKQFSFSARIHRMQF